MRVVKRILLAVFVVSLCSNAAIAGPKSMAAQLYREALTLMGIDNQEAIRRMEKVVQMTSPASKLHQDALRLLKRWRPKPNWLFQPLKLLRSPYSKVRKGSIRIKFIKYDSGFITLDLQLTKHVRGLYHKGGPRYAPNTTLAFALSVQWFEGLYFLPSDPSGQKSQRLLTFGAPIIPQSGRGKPLSLVDLSPLHAVRIKIPAYCLDQERGAPDRALGYRVATARFPASALALLRAQITGIKKAHQQTPKSKEFDLMYLRARVNRYKAMYGSRGLVRIPTMRDLLREKKQNELNPLGHTSLQERIQKAVWRLRREHSIQLQDAAVSK